METISNVYNHDFEKHKKERDNASIFRQSNFKQTLENLFVNPKSIINKNIHTPNNKNMDNNRYPYRYNTNPNFPFLNTDNFKKMNSIEDPHNNYFSVIGNNILNKETSKSQTKNRPTRIINDYHFDENENERFESRNIINRLEKKNKINLYIKKDEFNKGINNSNSNYNNDISKFNLSSERENHFNNSLFNNSLSHRDKDINKYNDNDIENNSPVFLDLIEEDNNSNDTNKLIEKKIKKLKSDKNVPRIILNRKENCTPIRSIRKYSYENETIKKPIIRKNTEEIGERIKLLRLNYEIGNNNQKINNNNNINNNINTINKNQKEENQHLILRIPNNKNTHNNNIYKENNNNNNNSNNDNNHYFNINNNYNNNTNHNIINNNINDDNNMNTNNLNNNEINSTNNEKIKENPRLKLNKKFEEGNYTEYSYVLSIPGKNDKTTVKTNQDSYLILEKINGLPNFNIYGIFDGHGSSGHLVSNFIVKYLTNYYKYNENIYNIKNIEIIYSILKRKNYSFIKQSIKKSEEALFDSDEIDSTFSGTTCILLFIIGNKIISVNIGDSRAIMLKDKNNIIQLSIDQKPENKEEKERIEKNGGELRRIIENNEEIGPIRVWVKGKKYPGIAMSRSIGDSVANEIGVWSIPEIKEFYIDDYYNFIVIGSDGLWEFLSNEKVGKFICKCNHQDKMSSFVKNLIEKAREKWEKFDEIIDDITVIFIYLKRDE